MEMSIFDNFYLSSCMSVHLVVIDYWKKERNRVTDRIKIVDHFKFIISLLWNRNHQDSYE